MPSPALLLCVSLLLDAAIPAEMPNEQILDPLVLDMVYPQYTGFWGLYFPTRRLVILRKGKEDQTRTHELAHHFQFMAGQDIYSDEAQAQAWDAQYRCGRL